MMWPVRNGGSLSRGANYAQGNTGALQVWVLLPEVCTEAAHSQQGQLMLSTRTAAVGCP